MTARFLRFVVAVFALLLTVPAFAEERGTTEEAQALVKKAVAHYKAVGREKALADFVAPNGEFMPKDLFIFVQDLKGTMIAHAKNPGFTGKDLSGLKDTDGKAFVAEMVKVATEKGAGWVDYKFVNPATKKIEPKTTYVERVGDVYIGCGAFKP
jgi:cytochrome c